MRKNSFGQKLKAIGAFLLILLLLPYIVSVFLNGNEMKKISRREEDESWIQVIKSGQEGEEKEEELEWTALLMGILAEEMPETYEPEALKAQAIIIRTALYEELEQTENKMLTVSYMDREEMEKRWNMSDYTVNYNIYKAAVETTDDMVLLFQDDYAWVPYHRSSSGFTRSAAEVIGSDGFPYIAVKECPADQDADEQVQVNSYEYGQIQQLCREFLVAEDKEKAESGYGFSDFEILALDSAGYVKEMRIGSTVCTGDQFRDALSLASSAFTLSEGEECLKITTTGNGHGLGMSQWTANEMAKEGKTCEEILQFFYEGTVINTDIQENVLLDRFRQ